MQEKITYAKDLFNLHFELTSTNEDYIQGGW